MGFFFVFGQSSLVFQLGFGSGYTQYYAAVKPRRGFTALRGTCFYPPALGVVY